MSEADERAEIERRARLICASLHAPRALSTPDTMVVRGSLPREWFGKATSPPGEIIPMWVLYAPAAERMIEDEMVRIPNRCAGSD